MPSSNWILTVLTDDVNLQQLFIMAYSQRYTFILSNILESLQTIHWDKLALLSGPDYCQG